MAAGREAAEAATMRPSGPEVSRCVFFEEFSTKDRHCTDILLLFAWKIHVLKLGKSVFSAGNSAAPLTWEERMKKAQGLKVPSFPYF